MRRALLPYRVAVFPGGPAFLAVALLLLVAGCGRASGPAPVVLKGTSQGTATAVPETRPRKTERAPAGAVSVARGDTLYSIARSRNVALRDLIDANGLRPPYKLRVGQRLRLPRGRTHRVGSGETLYGISRASRVDMASLARANKLRPPYLLQPGQVLRLPAAQGMGVTAASGPEKPAAKAVDRAPNKASDTRSTASAPRPRPQTARTALAKPPSRSGGRFLWPVRGKVVSGFGPKAGGLHNDGINIAVPRGAPVRAAENGIVAYSGAGLKGFGNLVLIRHADGWISAYGHNQTVLVKRGQRVKRGQTIARAGATGNVRTPQVHFELRRGTRAVDPRRHLERA